MQCTHAAQESCYHNDRVVTNYKMLYDGGAIYNESYSYVSDVFDMTQLANFPPQKSITKRKGNSPSSSESVGVGSFQQTTVELTREIPMSPGSAVGNSLLLPSSACLSVTQSPVFLGTSASRSRPVVAPGDPPSCTPRANSSQTYCRYRPSCNSAPSLRRRCWLARSSPSVCPC